MKHAARICLLLSLPLLWLGYVAAAHVYLNGPAFRRLINPPGGPVRIDFRSAESLWPGQVRARGLAVAGQHGAELRWRVEADEARIGLNPWALRQRRVELAAVSGKGVRVFFRTGRALPPAVRAAAPPLPPLAFAPAPPGAPSTGPGWQVWLDDLALTQVTEVWVDELRYTGDGDLHGALTVGDGHVAVPALDLRLGAGRLAVDVHPTVALSRLVVSGSLAPLRVDSATSDGVEDAIRARLELAVHTTGIGFLAAYLRAAPWLALGRGEGTLTADLRFEHGVFTPGSHLTVASDTFEVAAFGQRARGRGNAVARVTGPAGGARLALALILQHYTLGPLAGGATPVAGDRLHLDVAGPNPRLGHPLASWRARLRLPRATVHDLTYLNGFLPRGAPARILGGQGTLSASLVAQSSGRAAGSGHVHVQAERVAAIVAGTSVRGDVDASLVMTSVDPAAGLFEVSGSRLDLTHVVTQVGSERQTDWWSRLTFSKAQAKVTRPVAFTGDVRLVGKDLRPLAALLAKAEGLPKWAQNALSLTGLAASATLAADDRRFRLTDGIATAEDVRLDAWYERADGRQHGRVLLEKGPIDVGAALEGHDLSWKLLGARSWFDRDRPLAH